MATKNCCLSKQPCTWKAWRASGQSCGSWGSVSGRRSWSRRGTGRASRWHGSACVSSGWPTGWTLWRRRHTWILSCPGTSSSVISLIAQFVCSSRKRKKQKHTVEELCSLIRLTAITVTCFGVESDGGTSKLSPCVENFIWFSFFIFW